MFLTTTESISHLITHKCVIGTFSSLRHCTVLEEPSDCGVRCSMVYPLAFDESFFVFIRYLPPFCAALMSRTQICDCFCWFEVLCCRRREFISQLDKLRVVVIEMRLEGHRSSVAAYWFEISNWRFASHKLLIAKCYSTELSLFDFRSALVKLEKM